MGAPVHHRMLLIYHDAWFATVGGVVITAIVALPLLPLAAGVLARIRRALGMSPRHAWRSSALDVGLLYGVGVPIWLTMLPGGNREISLVPFRDMATLPPYEIVGNMLLLAAVGALVPLRFRALASVPRATLVAMALSCAIETCQYVLPIGRVASVDDVILNTAGAAVAALGSWMWWRPGARGDALTREASEEGDTLTSDPILLTR